MYIYICYRKNNPAGTQFQSSPSDTFILQVSLALNYFYQIARQRPVLNHKTNSLSLHVNLHFLQISGIWHDNAIGKSCTIELCKVKFQLGFHFLMECLQANDLNYQTCLACECSSLSIVFFYTLSTHSQEKHISPVPNQFLVGYGAC